jgi:hypothetical protein
MKNRHSQALFAYLGSLINFTRLIVDHFPDICALFLNSLKQLFNGPFILSAKGRQWLAMRIVPLTRRLSFSAQVQKNVPLTVAKNARISEKDSITSP